MFRRAILAAACGLLTACGDPLAGLDKISDVELSQTDPTAAALPTEAEVAREGFFGTDAAEGGVVVDPVAVAPARKRGLLGLFRRAQPADAEADAVAAAVASSESDVAAVDGAVVVDTPVVAGESLTQEASPEEVQLAALNPEPIVADVPKRRGLFGRKASADTPKKRIGPDARDVDYDTVLAFGEVARSCAARGRPLGRKVEKSPARGYALYDSRPGFDGPRTFYITGFGDGCPRQLTAANVLLGSASLYEQLHYGPGGDHLPSGATDKAYEKVKRQVCGARRGKPCGAKINKMERSTFFVTAYSRFGNANTWSELLVHDGEILAAAIKSNN